ncbi:MAG: peptide deformylase, partial [Oscillospiraceae bacterium]
MAIRSIVTKEDSLLSKHSRPITEFNDRLHILLDDMKETLTVSGGVGLAGPQVGVLRRAVIVIETNVPEDEEEYFIELINPEIIFEEGEQTGPEGCLSFPGQYGIVTRPDHVKVRAQDRYGNFFEVEGEALTARCFCHEIDHLNGILFPERAERMLTTEELSEKKL